MVDAPPNSAEQALQSLQRSLREVVSSKSLVLSHAKRISSPTDTQMLRQQLNQLLVRLKQQLEEGSAAATTASRALMNVTDVGDSRYAQQITSLQQMERQLMQVANEYPALVKHVAEKEQKSPPQPPPRLQKNPEELPLLANAGQSESSSLLQAHVQTQVQSVSQTEAQQLGQELQERDRDIHQLVGTAVEIQQVAADIAALIDHQGAAVDQVAVQIGDVAQHIEMGAEQVEIARARQRKFRIDFCGWMCIVVGVICGLYLGFSVA